MHTLAINTLLTRLPPKRLLLACSNVRSAILTRYREHDAFREYHETAVDSAFRHCRVRYALWIHCFLFSKVVPWVPRFRMFLAVCSTFVAAFGVDGGWVPLRRSIADAWLCFHRTSMTRHRQTPRFGFTRGCGTRAYNRLNICHIYSGSRLASVRSSERTHQLANDYLILVFLL